MRRRLIAGLCAVFVALVAACGEPEATQRNERVADLSEEIELAADKARDEGSARVVIATSMELPAASGGGKITTAGRGVIQMDPPLGKMEMFSAGEGGAAKQVGQMMGRMEMVMEGLVVYIKAPFFQTMLQTDAEWVRMDLQALGEEMGIDLGQLTQGTTGVDTSGGLNYFTGAKEVEEVGAEEIRGVETTHYRGVVDLETIPEDLIPAAQVDQLVNLMGQSTFPFDVWLDDDGLPARVVYEFDYSKSQTPGMGAMKMTMDYVEWGVDVRVNIPPKSDTVDMLELIREQGGTFAPPGS